LDKIELDLQVFVIKTTTFIEILSKWSLFAVFSDS